MDRIYASEFAFAAKLVDGSVVTWGDAPFGGDSSSVQMQLKGVDKIYPVDKIYSSRGAFAAKLVNGDLVTWGLRNYGADSSSVLVHITKREDEEKRRKEKRREEKRRKM